MRYRVKNFSSPLAIDVQEEVKRWVEAREHVTIHTMSTWCDSSDSSNCCTIVYTENEYNL